MPKVSVWDLPGPDEYRFLRAEVRADAKKGKFDTLNKYLKHEGHQLSEFLVSLGLENVQREQIDGDIDGDGVLFQLESVAGSCPGELVEFLRRASKWFESPFVQDAAQLAILKSEVLEQIDVVADAYVADNLQRHATSAVEGVWVRRALRIFLDLVIRGFLDFSR